MAKAPNRRVLDVRVDVQATHANRSTVLDDDEESLTWLVEAVDASLPLVPGATDERMTFGCSDLLEAVDFRTTRGQVTSDFVGHMVNRTTHGPQG